MPIRRTINAKEIVKDVRSHMTDAWLMDKYRLSARGLQSVLDKLLGAKLITQAEHAWRPMDYEDTVTLNLDFLLRD
jgi:hypothetical protein